MRHPLHILLQFVVLAIGVVSFWSTMGRSSVSWYATVSPSLTKAFPSNVVSWGIMVLKPLEGSLLEVEAVEGSLCGVDGVFWSYGQAPSNHVVQSERELTFSLDCVTSFLAGTSTVGYMGEEDVGIYLVSRPPSSRCCRRKNPPAGLLHCHHGLDCGRDSGRCL